MTDGLSPLASLNHSDAWLRSSAAHSDVWAVDPDAPRRVYLDANCDVFCLVSPKHYAWVTQWRWKWIWDRTKTKRYAIRTTRKDGRHVTIYMHKEILNATGKVQPTEAHTIGDHQDGESLNNQDDNVEWATKSMNRRNRKR